MEKMSARPKAAKTTKKSQIKISDLKPKKDAKGGDAAIVVKQK
jgi:hypothetical protein